MNKVDRACSDGQPVETLHRRFVQVRQEAKKSPKSLACQDWDDTRMEEVEGEEPAAVRLSVLPWFHPQVSLTLGVPCQYGRDIMRE